MASDDFDQREDAHEQNERRRRRANEQAEIVDVAHIGTQANWDVIHPRLDQAAAALNAAGHRCHVTGAGDQAGLAFDEAIEHDIVVKVLRDVGLRAMAAVLEAEARLRDGD